MDCPAGPDACLPGHVFPAVDWSSRRLQISVVSPEKNHRRFIWDSLHQIKAWVINFFHRSDHILSPYLPSSSTVALSSPLMPVSENETALSRGQVPTYMRRQLNDLLAVMLQPNASCNRNSILLTTLNDEDICLHIHRHRRRHRKMVTSLFNMMHNHFTSYDMVMRPTVLFRNPPMANPVDELTSYNFYHYSGFWPDQFTEICENLILIPDVVICERTRCSAKKKLALFLLLWQWNKADTWDNVTGLLHCGRCWCIQIYQKMFSLLKRHYRRCVQVLDFQQIIPLFSKWSDQIAWHSGARLLCNASNITKRTVKLALFTITLGFAGLFIQSFHMYPGAWKSLQSFTRCSSTYCCWVLIFSK